MAIGNPITLTSNVASKTISVIATAGQTLFTVTGGYRINQLAVFRNGVRLLDSRDYEARNGSTVTLLSAATVGDALEFQVFDDFRVADAIVSAESEQTISGNLTVSGILTATDLRGSDVTFRHVKATGISTVSDTTQSTTTTTGALIVSGGLGVAKNLFVGGSMNVAGTLTYEDVTNSETAGVTTTGGLVVTGLGATFGSGVGIADSIYHIDDSNTAIRFPAADTFTVTTAGSEALRVDSSQRLLVNTDSAMETFGSAALQVATAAGGTLVLGRDDTSVSVDNGLGAIYFDTKAGGSFAESAVISAEADAAQGSGDYPSRLVFKTTADGAGSVTERVRIDNNGRIGINSTPGTLLELTGRSGEEAVVTFNREGVQGTADGTIGRIIYENHTDSVASIDVLRGGANDEAYIRFATQNESGSFGERVRIHQNGNVGIATTNPLGKLSLLADDSQDDPDIVFQSASGIGLAHAALSTTDDSGGTDLMVGSNFYLSTNGNETRFATGRSGTAIRFGYSGTMRFYTNSGSNAPTERLRIDSSGRMLIGATSNVGSSSVLQVREDGFGRNFEIFRSYDSANTPARIRFSNSRGTSASPTIVVDGDDLGEIRFNGHDGTNYDTPAAAIFGTVDGTPGENDMPGRLEFHTTSDGGSSTTERLRITSTGRIGIGTADPQGFLVIQGNSNDSTTPSIRLQDGTDARQASITNSSGDLILFNSGSDNTPHCKLTMFDGNILTLATTNTERLRIDSVGTLHFKTGALVENGIVDSTARTGTQAVNLDNGMVHYFTASATGTWKPNFRVNSTNTLNSAMGTGDICSPTMVVNKSNTAHYADSVQVDGTDRTIEWLGGAPTDGGGNNTFDVYNYTIIKTADDTFIVFASVSTYE